MPILTVSGVHIDFPDLTDPTRVEAEFVLNWLRLQRITNRMAHWMRKQPSTPTHAEFQAELLRIDAEFSWSDVEDGVIRAPTETGRSAAARSVPPTSHRAKRPLEPHPADRHEEGRVGKFGRRPPQETRTGVQAFHAHTGPPTTRRS
jgi:hypothetical protein